jgi:hypothetical protein
VIVLTNWALSKRFGVNDFGQLSHASGTIALIFGIGVGLATAGVLPGLHSLQFGFPCLQAWFSAALVFAALRIREYSRAPRFAIAMVEEKEKELALT